HLMNRERHPLTRRDLVATTAGCTALPRARGAAQSLPAKPNIGLIVADDLGYGHLGCYGPTKIRTPHPCRLAAGGKRFRQFYSGCTVCAPSRCALMTGRHTGHCSVRSNSGGVPLLESDVTMGAVLKKAGYATGGFGKWGLGDADTAGAPGKHGFDEFFGYL